MWRLMERRQATAERSLLTPPLGKVCENQYFADFQCIIPCIFLKPQGIKQRYHRVASVSFAFSRKVILTVY